MRVGEAKRRKQRLGSRYGKPLGLSSAERVNLIEQNIERWISEHFDNCQYDNYLLEPYSIQTRVIGDTKFDLESVLEEVIEHFVVTFSQTYSDVAIEMLISGILKDRPILFEGISNRQGQTMEPIIALPLARKYFQEKVHQRKIELSTHQILVKEVLLVLGQESQRGLVKQLLRGEFNEVIDSAQEEQKLWLTKNLNADGWINVNKELLFQAVNTAMAGILTMVATLPWQIQLNLILPATTEL